MDKLLLNKDRLLVGIFSTSQQVKYGKTSSGKPIYMIKPIDKSLPSFWMTFGSHQKGKLVVLFKYSEKLSTNKNTLPFGELYRIIGPATDNLITALLYNHQIFRKDLKIKLTINPQELNIKRKDLTDLNIFSIDPKGCVDIDDALSIEKINNKYIVGVHIAQPIYWLTKNDIIERYKCAFSTLYVENNIELWSKEIVMESSLIANKIRPAYSILFTIEDNKIINTESFPSMIINKLNTNYEEIDYPHIKELNILSEKILNKQLDSHELVAEWMVLTNNYIGKTFKNIPYRVQSISNNMDVSDNEIKKLFNNFSMESAEYSYDKEYHASLDLIKYTHFTSPIRRIIDTIIHYSITYNDTFDIDIDRINFLDKQTKKFHRQIEFNKIVDNIKDFDTIGWLYKKMNNIWLVYFKELGLVKVIVVDNKLAYLVKQEEYDKYIIGNSYPFKIYKKEGFLPSEKILIVPDIILYEKY